jgi:hypothetical protein
VLGGGRACEIQRVGHDPFEEAVAKAFVRFEETPNRITLRFEDAKEAFVLVCVAAFLSVKTAHLLRERRIVDAVRVLFHAAHEEALAGGKQQIDAVDEVRGNGASAEPVARDRIVEAKVHAARDGPRARRRGGAENVGHHGRGSIEL